MELSHVQSKQRDAAATNDDDENAVSAEYAIAAVAGVDSGNTSSAENPAVSSDIKVRFTFLCLCRCQFLSSVVWITYFVLNDLLRSSSKL